MPNSNSKSTSGTRSSKRDTLSAKSSKKLSRTTRSTEIRESPARIIDLERDADHRYWFRREGSPERTEALGVTRTLIEQNLIDDEYFNDRARGRGRLAHFFAERLLTNTLDRPIDVDVLPYMVGLRKWLDKFGPIVRNAEVLMINPNILLGGTVDLDVAIEFDNIGEVVVEIKTGEPTAWHGLQLAAYAYLLDGPRWLLRRRFGLYLNLRSGFKFIEYDDHTDLDYFLRAHELLHWRIRHGSIERPYGRRALGDGRGSEHIHDDGSGDRRTSFDGDPEW